MLLARALALPGRGAPIASPAKIGRKRLLLALAFRGARRAKAVPCDRHIAVVGVIVHRRGLRQPRPLIPRPVGAVSCRRRRGFRCGLRVDRKHRIAHLQLLAPPAPSLRLTVPLNVEGTSTTALSVSSSSTVWPEVTSSPGCTATRTTSPDSIFSPSSGNLNSATDAVAAAARDSVPRWRKRRPCCALSTLASSQRHLWLRALLEQVLLRWLLCRLLLRGCFFRRIGEQHIPHLHALARSHDNFFNCAVDRRRHLDHRLIGFQLNHGLAFVDRLTTFDSDSNHVASSMFSPSSGSLNSSVATRFPFNECGPTRRAPGISAPGAPLCKWLLSGALNYIRHHEANGSAFSELIPSR